MQIHGPAEPIATIPVERYTGGTVVMRLPCKVVLVIESAADCDQLMIAAAQARDMLTGGSLRDLAAAEASPANPYGSAAVVAEDVLPLSGDLAAFAQYAEEAERCPVIHSVLTGRRRCVFARGHEGDHHDSAACTWPQEASAAEVAQDVDRCPECARDIATEDHQIGCPVAGGVEPPPCHVHSEPQYVQDPTSYYICDLPAGHSGDHAAFEADGEPLLIWPPVADGARLAAHPLDGAL